MEKVEEPPKCDPRNYARYYDTPDGCNVDTKVMVASRYGIVAGLIAGTYDVLMYSHVVGLMPILSRYARHVVPIGLMGATFAVVANAVQHAREADDPLNYFLGGLACGPLVALYTRSKHGIVAGGIFLGIAGVIKKESVDRGVAIFPKYPRGMNTITGAKRDFSLVRDPRDDMRHTCDDDFDDDDDDDYDEEEEAAAAQGAKKKKKKKKKKVC
ncbi:NADH dehydrogenase [ubiquinone] 1 alpha subcomplex subunit 11 [Helicoverpa armigera]|uniref:NADH dehydrogenase [ubiquinone] 1 alpha subcomplex subunit 11 n=1 Tax=Helicoverpa armigera TaxID=29058 RepID=UPI0030830DD4